MKRFINKHITKIILFIIGICFVINFYYSFHFMDESRTLNSNPWKTYKFGEEKWIEFEHFEIACYKTDIFLFKKQNPSGLTYNMRIRVRYKSENAHIAREEIEKFEMLSPKEYENAERANYVGGNARETGPENYLVFINGIMGKDFFLSDKDGYFYSDAAAIQFYTGFIPDRVIGFRDSQGKPLLIKTNPMILFQSDYSRTVLFILVILLLGVFMLKGSFENFTMFFVLWIGFGRGDYLFWLVLISLLFISVFLRIKVRIVQLKWLLRFLEYWEISRFIFPVLAVGVFAYIYNLGGGFSLSKVLISLMGAVFIPILAWLIVWAFASGLYTIYMYCRFPKKKFVSLELSKPVLSWVGSNLRKIPSYSADLLLNGSIKIKGADISAGMYKTLEAGKKVEFYYYIEDGRGNYLFF